MKINFDQKELEIRGKDDACNEKDLSENQVNASAIYPSHPKTHLTISRAHPVSKGKNYLWLS